MARKKRLRRQQNSWRPIFPAAEILQAKLVLSSAWAVPGAIPVEVMGPEGKLIPRVAPSPVGFGYTPQQLQSAYGLNQLSFAGIKGDGKGQTIALVDAYDNPGFLNSSDPNFANSSLHQFDLAFGLPDPPSFTKVNQNGQTTGLPQADSGWGPEIALDIEWAHAMAPGANIILVEANSPDNNLFTAAAEAAKLATVVSMSWGGNEDSSELGFDSTFQVPGVTFLASTGDGGQPGGYPAYSPHVVAVGGTTLQNLNSTGTYPGTGNTGEVGWSSGGGGISQIEPEPAFQNSVQSTGHRTIPDIAADADPNTGVPVYDPTDSGAGTPWTEYGGTSLSSPLMAGMIAIADQGRVKGGGQTFSSDQVLTDLYSLQKSKPGDFHDILYGNNGFSAGPGYDYVTGLGTPNGSQLVPDLASVAVANLTSITVTPSQPSVGEGLTEQFTATGTYSDGSTQDITSSVTWASATTAVATINASGLATTHSVGTSVITASLNGITSPGDTLTSLPLVSLTVAPNNPSVSVFSTVQFTVTGKYSDGSTHSLPGTSVAWASSTTVATIDTTGLATAKAVGTSTITASAYGVTSPGDVLTVTAPSFVVNTTQDAISAANGKTTLRAAILAANAASGNTTITFDPTVFASLQTITLTLGELELSNKNAIETIVGPAAGVKVTGGGQSRVFQVDAGVRASLSKMTISGGKTAGMGGGLFNLGTTTLTNCIVSGNSATDGGGIMDYAGNTALTNCTISGNSATGSPYSSGGGLENSQGTATLTNCTVSGNSAARDGGGIFGASGTTMLANCTVSGNSSYLGGGVSIGGYGAGTLTNCTVSGNSATLGGGLFVGSVTTYSGYYGTTYYGTAALTNCTVSGNSAFAGGGLYNQGTLNLGNAIVARNTASYLGPDAFGTINSAGHNLVGATDGSAGWTGSDLTGTASLPLNPLLAPLGNFGGPTKTMPLLPGSPAIDAGASNGAPVTDQRGKGRVGPVDIGAFESQGFTLTPVAGSTPQTTLVGTTFSNLLTVTVKAKNPIEPVNGGVIRFAAIPASNGASASLSAPSAVIAFGNASVKATANKVAGTYTVTASASGVVSAGKFVLTNKPGGIASVKSPAGGTAKPLTPSDGVQPLPKVGNTGFIFIRETGQADSYGIVFDLDEGGFISLADYNHVFTMVNTALHRPKR